MASFGRAYLRWAARAPFSSQVAVATSKTVAADMLVQSQIEGKQLHEIDYRRVGIFGAFGFLYLGVAQYGIYVNCMQRVFDKVALDKFCNASFREKLRDKVGLQILAGTIAIDFVLIQPFLYWPAYYLVKEAGYQQKNEGGEKAADKSCDEDGGNFFSNAMSKYGKNCVDDNLGMCGFWLPMDMIIYSVPLHLRLHLNHIISFAWVAIVSVFRGDKEPTKDEA